LQIFSIPFLFGALIVGDPLEIHTDHWVAGLLYGVVYVMMFGHFGRTPDCGGRTDRHRAVRNGIQTVQITPLRRTLASSPQYEGTICHQQGHADSNKERCCGWNIMLH